MRPILSALFTVGMPALFLAGCNKTSDTNLADANVTVPVASPTATASYQVYRTYKGEAAPTGEFTVPGGGKATLAKFAGKPFLVSLWPILCDRCASQLTNLDTLAAEGKIPVVALNTDVGMSATTDNFMQAHQFKALHDYRTPNLSVIAPYRGAGGPTTVLYDSQGKTVWWITGEADFSKPDVRALLDEAK
jgi:thiol-disulfide isomerase/thioredoxin